MCASRAMHCGVESVDGDWPPCCISGIAAELFFREKVIAFLGPGCSLALDPVGRMAAYWNIPVITGTIPIYTYATFLLEHIPVITGTIPRYTYATFLLEHTRYHRYGTKIHVCFAPIGIPVITGTIPRYTYATCLYYIYNNCSCFLFHYNYSDSIGSKAQKQKHNANDKSQHCKHVIRFVCYGQA